MIAFRDNSGPTWAVVHLEMHLRRQDDVLTTGVLVNGAADDLLRATDPVDVRGVPKGDAELDRLTKERPGLLIAQ